MSRTDRSIVVSSFSNPMHARDAIAELRERNYSDKNIGVLTLNDKGDAVFRSFKDLEGNKAGTGAAVGAVAGAGGGALWALGIAAGILPAIGPVIAGGFLAALLASSAGGAAAGGLIGSLVGLGIDDEDAAYAADELHAGRTVVVVKGSDTERALAVLMRAGGSTRPTYPTSESRPQL